MRVRSGARHATHFCDHCPMPTPPLPHPAPLLVACLCANWCGTCRDYQPLFHALGLQFPHLRFVWIDIEDEADWVDPIEVENFPTILIASPHQTLFFGTVLPHIHTLQRLVETQVSGDTRPPPADPDVDDLVAKLWQRVGSAA